MFVSLSIKRCTTTNLKYLNIPFKVFLFVRWSWTQTSLSSSWSRNFFFFKYPNKSIYTIASLELATFFSPPFHEKKVSFYCNKPTTFTQLSYHMEVWEWESRVWVDGRKHYESLGTAEKNISKCKKHPEGGKYSRNNINRTSYIVTARLSNPKKSTWHFPSSSLSSLPGSSPSSSKCRFLVSALLEEKGDQESFCNQSTTEQVYTHTHTQTRIYKTTIWLR